MFTNGVKRRTYSLAVVTCGRRSRPTRGAPMTAADRYRRWFEYERDAHDKVIRSLESVPGDRRSSPEYRRAVTILAHIAVARQMWLYRFGQAKDRPPSFFP